MNFDDKSEKIIGAINFYSEDNYKDLIPFYLSRGLEIPGDFYNKPIFSLVIKCDEEFIGAATCSKKDENYIIEAIAISEKNVRKGFGKKLMNEVLNKIEMLNGSDIYLVAKEPIFFEKNGFVVINQDEAPDFSDCFMCPDYKVSCFPSVMKHVR